MMGPKAILTMAVLCVALFGLYAVQRHSKPSYRAPVKAAEKIGARWDPKEVHRIQLMHGDDEHDVIALLRTSDGWILAGKGQLRADAGAIDKLLGDLKDLEGEKRESTGGPEALPKLGLDDKSAIRVLLVDQNDHALFHLVAGVRAEGRDGSFVRLAEGEAVWIASRDLRDAVGADKDGHLNRKKWLDLSVVSLKAEEIERVTVTGPESVLVVERREKPDPADAAKKITEWVLTTPPLPSPAKAGEVAKIANALSALRAEDVPDPEKLKDTGLATPTYEAVAKTKDGKETRVSFGNVVPGMEGQRFTKVSGRNQVYAVSKWDLQELFPPIGRLSDLPGLGFSKDKIARATLRDAWKEIAFIREVTGTWRTEPALPVPVKADEVLAMIEAAASAKPEDLLAGVSDEAAGLARPEGILELQDSAGGKYEIRLGGKRAGNEQQRYVRLSNYDRVAVMSAMSAGTVFPGLRELVELRPLRIERDHVQGMTIEGAGRTIRLNRAGGWSVFIGGVTFEARQEGVDRLLNVASDFRPTDLVTRAPARGVEHSLRFLLAEGREVLLRLGRLGEQGSDLYARIGDDPLIYRITKFEFEMSTFAVGDVAVMTWPTALTLGKATGGGIASEKGEAAIAKGELRGLTVLDVVPSSADSGVEASKERLTFTLEGGGTASVFFGGGVKDRPGARYGRVEGSEGLLVLKEEEVAELLKRIR